MQQRPRRLRLRSHRQTGSNPTLGIRDELATILPEPGTAATAGLETRFGLLSTVDSRTA